MRLALTLALLVLLSVPGRASAEAYLPPPGKVFAGVASGYDLRDYVSRTGRRPSVWQHWIRWDGGIDFTFRHVQSAGTRLMLHLSTAEGQNMPGRISPGEIARGQGDAFIIRLNRTLARYGEPVYLRLFAEMNNCDLAYSSHDCSGRRRGGDHSAAGFKRAWRRIALIVRGGRVDRIDARLKRLGMPALKGAPKDRVVEVPVAPPVPKLPGLPGVGELPDAGETVGKAVERAALPEPKVALMWSPMTGGSPMIAVLRPGVFWPGARYVDWVSTSFYSRYPNFRWLTPFYRQFADRHRKPFAFGEWAMWGSDSAGFVRSLFAWVRSHRRTRMMIYNQGADSTGPFRLGGFPAAQRALRDELRASRFE